MYNKIFKTKNNELLYTIYCNNFNFFYKFVENYVRQD